jgi:hypothetical protein
MLTTNQMLVRLGSWQLHKSGQKSGPGSAANVLLASMYASEGWQHYKEDNIITPYKKWGNLVTPLSIKLYNANPVNSTKQLLNY